VLNVALTLPFADLPSESVRDHGAIKQFGALPHLCNRRGLKQLAVLHGDRQLHQVGCRPGHTSSGTLVTRIHQGGVTEMAVLPFEVTLGAVGHDRRHLIHHHVFDASRSPYTCAQVFAEGAGR